MGRSVLDGIWMLFLSDTCNRKVFSAWPMKFSRALVELVHTSGRFNPTKKVRDEREIVCP